MGVKPTQRQSAEAYGDICRVSWEPNLVGTALRHWVSSYETSIGAGPHVIACLGGDDVATTQYYGPYESSRHAVAASVDELPCRETHARGRHLILPLASLTGEPREALDLTAEVVGVRGAVYAVVCLELRTQLLSVSGPYLSLRDAVQGYADIVASAGATEADERLHCQFVELHRPPATGPIS